MPELHESWDEYFDEEGARCPYCGEIDEFSGDHPSDLQRDGDSTEIECGSCGEPFQVTMSVSYSYSTKPLFIGPKFNTHHWSNVRREMRERGELPALTTPIGDFHE